MSVAVDARERVFGLSREAARDQRGGTAIGRARMSGTVSEPQYQASQQYLRNLKDYQIAIDAPKQIKAVNYDGITGGGSPVTPEWAQDAIRRHTGALKAIKEAQGAYRAQPGLLSALNLFVVQDRQIYNLEGDLRLVLNALVRHYGLDRVV